MDAAESRHRLLAILAADAVGYSRLMGVDERTTVATLDAARERMHEEVARRHGRVVDTAGDSMLAVFDAAGGALEAARAFQQAWSQGQARLAPDRRLAFRIGVHLGDVIEKPDGSVYGNGVNVAARLQALAGPGEVWLSDAVRVAIAGLSARLVEDRGDHAVKNISEPVHAFRLRPASEGDDPGPPRAPGSGWRSRRLLVGVSLAAAAAAAVAALAWAYGAALLPAPDRVGDGGLRPASLAIGPISVDGSDAGASARAADLRRGLGAALTAPAHRQMLSTQVLDDQPASAAAASTLARARALGVRYVLEGSLRRVAEGDVVTLTLVDAATGIQRWSAPWTPVAKHGEPAAGDALQRLADSVAAQVLDHESRRVTTLPAGRLAPVELVLRGIAAHEARPTLQGIDEALALADRALSLNPAYPPALNLKAFLLLNRYEEESNPDHDRHARELDDLTARMLALDAQDPYSWSLRVSAMMLAGRWRAADEAVERLMKAAGPTPFALGVRAGSWLQTGRVADALREVQSEPLRSGSNAWTPVIECHAQLLLKRLQEAVEACETAVGRSPMLWSAHLYLAAAHALMGHAERSRASLQIVDRMSPGHTIARLRANRQWAHPDYQRLAQETYYAGLRRAGMPER